MCAKALHQNSTAFNVNGLGLMRVDTLKTKCLISPQHSAFKKIQDRSRFSTVIEMLLQTSVACGVLEYCSKISARGKCLL